MAAWGGIAEHDRVTIAVDAMTGPDTLEKIHRAFAQYWSQHPEISHEVRTQMELAASEIAANIIEHSAPARVRLQMDLDVSPDEMRTTFHDDGNPVEVDLDTVQMPPTHAERGRGLAIATAVLDALRYWRGRNVNNWMLTRSLRR